MSERFRFSTTDWAKLPAAFRVFLVTVLLPTLLAAFYYGLVASDRYVSEAHFALRSSSDIQVGGILDSVFGSAGGRTSSEDDSIVNDYIMSLDMLQKLDQALDLRGHYSSDKIDILSRLDADASQEDFLKYYQDHVEVQFDTDTLITTLRVRAYDPEYARKVAQEIINLSEDLVNELSVRITEDTIKFARKEVDLSEERVRKAANAVTAFRTQSRTIDPSQETTAVLGIVTQLESNLAAAKAELIQAMSYMKPDSAQVQTLRARVEALKKQVEDERERIADSSAKGKDFTSLIDSYEPLMLEKTLAEQRYSSSLTSLEVARAEAQRKQRYLITFVLPQLPDDAVEPKRLVAVISVFFGAMLLYGIAGLIWAAIKDHMRM